MVVLDVAGGLRGGGGEETKRRDEKLIGCASHSKEAKQQKEVGAGNGVPQAIAFTSRWRATSNCIYRPILRAQAIVFTGPWHATSSCIYAVSLGLTQLADGGIFVDTQFCLSCSSL